MIADQDVVVKACNVYKKFCKNLKRSMAYGIVELSKNLLGVRPESSHLMKDEFWAVEDISFELRRGQVLGLIGPNGSGKTTLLRLIAGIFPPDSGEIMIKGKVGALISLGAGFHPHMTGRENIYLNGTILGMSHDEIKNKFYDILEFAEIDDFIDAPVSTYSSGMRVRLGFSIAAQLSPDLLLIDEVLAVGDIGFRTKCLNAIDKITRNAAVIFVSHQMPQVTRICSDIIVLERAKAVFQGKDCLKGVEYYYSRLNPSQRRTSGTKRAKIHSVALHCDKPVENENAVFKAEIYSTLYIDVTFSIAAEINEAIMNVVFFTRDERTAAQCDSNNCDFKIINNGKMMSARIEIPLLPLNPGRFNLSLILLDNQRHEVLIQEHAVKELQIVGNFMGYTPVQLKGNWQLLSDGKGSGLQ